MARRVTGTKQSALDEVQLFIRDIMDYRHITCDLAIACGKFYAALASMKGDVIVGVGKFIENEIIKQEKECEDDVEMNEIYQQFMGDSTPEPPVFYHIDPELILSNLLKKEKHVIQSKTLTALINDILNCIPTDYEDFID